MRTLRLISTLLLFMGIGLAATGGEQPVSADEGNLLTNPSFEGEYTIYIPSGGHPDCPTGACNTVQLPAGWQPWWVKERPSDGNPEYKPAEAPFSNRVHSGARAAQYFTFYRTHKAGYYQQVSVPNNAVVRFTIWGQAWMTESDSAVSEHPVPINMRIGIDPTGGANVYNPAIVWSGFQQPFDEYQPFAVEARAQGDRVTVFTFSAPDTNPYTSEYGMKHVNAYWDTAALVVVGAGSAPAPAPPPSGGDNTGGSIPAAPAPAAPMPVGPTPTPDAEGDIYHVVQSGDSMWSIAARAGITLDQLLELNNLSRESFIQAGQQLLLGRVEPPPASVEEEEEESEMAVSRMQEAEQPEPAPTLPPPTPTVVPTPEVKGGDICLKAFDDLNRNGMHDPGESLRASVVFTIADGATVHSNYVTDGVSEPTCIQGLPAGSYRISRSQLPREELTTDGNWAVSLSDGTILHLEFGSYLAEATELAALEAPGGAVPAEGSSLVGAAIVDSGDSGGWANGVVIAAIALALLLLVGVLVVILSARRAQV
jgi:murein DD-endopeptidase MepM/ murein hydrolase activator NlpD